MRKKALMISCFNWYKARLEPIGDLLKVHNYDVTVLIADFDHIRKVPILERYEECTYIHVPSYKSNISIQRIISHVSFGCSIKKIVKCLKPDLIYVQIPPNNVAGYCVKYRKEHESTVLILDIIDLWPESVSLRIKNSLLWFGWKKWRNDCIRVADYIFTECELYKEKLKDVLNVKKTSTLYLFKEQTTEEKKLVQETIESRCSDGKFVKFAYLGSMNNIIDIDGICSVIKFINSCGIKTELHAIGDGENRKKFKTAVERVGCQAHFYGLVFDELEKIKILAACDYAFNMMKDSLQVGLTIKSIDYLSYGLPLINNIKGDTWRMVEKEGIGINVVNGEIDNLFFDHHKIVQFYRNKFTKDSFMRTIEDVYYERLRNR